MNAFSQDQRWIAAHIPHAGSMCLLDGVVSFDPDNVLCQASSHRLADNPLREDGMLLSAHAIEYAAQAMAVHAALLAGDAAERPAAGFLASVRDVQWQVPRLDDLPAPLCVAASRLFSEGNNVLYEFSLSSQGQTLVSGRAAVVMNAAAHLES